MESPWLYEKPWYKPGKWNVCAFMWGKKIQERMPMLSRKVLPTDTTLREGLEMAGVHMDAEGYVEMASRLADVGVKETDCGYAATPEQVAGMKRITDAGVKISTRIITRTISENWKEQIDIGAENGADVIKLQCNGGELWRTKVRRPELYKLKKSGQYLPLVVENINYLQDEYPRIFIQAGITGSLHTDIEFLKQWAKTSVDAGADRVSFSDSIGIGTPQTMQYLCEEIKPVIGGADLQVHCHNDFGMAESNTIGAVIGGCTSFDCTVNGLGDRAGNASLEECVVALEILYGVETGVAMEKLYDLCKWTEEKTGIVMARTKAITGPGAFFEESHLGAKLSAQKHGLTGDWFLPYDPSIVGQSHMAGWGSTSILDNNIAAKLENMGLSYKDEDVKEIRRRGWEIINTKKSGEAFIYDADFEKIIKEVLKK